MKTETKPRFQSKARFGIMIPQSLITDFGEYEMKLVKKDWHQNVMADWQLVRAEFKRGI